MDKIHWNPRWGCQFPPLGLAASRLKFQTLNSESKSSQHKNHIFFHFATPEQSEGLYSNIWPYFNFIYPYFSGERGIPHTCTEIFSRCLHCKKSQYFKFMLIYRYFYGERILQTCTEIFPWHDPGVGLQKFWSKEKRSWQKFPVISYHSLLTLGIMVFLISKKECRHSVRKIGQAEAWQLSHDHFDQSGMM